MSRFITFAVLANYPFFKFLHHHHYPLFNPEVLIMGTLSLVVFFITSLLCKNKTLYAFVIVLLLLFLLTAGPTDIKPAGLMMRAGVMLFLFFLLRLIPAPITKIVGVFLLGMALAELFWVGSIRDKKSDEVAADNSSTQKNQQMGNIFYIILDEQIGVAGLPALVNESEKMRKELTYFYTTNGFDLYTRAYSNYFYTDNSISNTLNGTYFSEQGSYFKASPQKRRLSQNRLFDHFSQLGYDIRVYAPDYIDFCTPKVSSCTRYVNNSPLALARSPLKIVEKMWVIGSLYLSTNSLFKEWEKRATDRNLFKTRTGPLAVVPELFSDIKKELKNNRSHTLYFAHVMMPHHPYVYDASCQIKPAAQWLNRHEFNSPKLQNSISGYVSRYRAYDDQIRCLNIWLKSLFDDLRAEGLYENTMIVIHGDHGSRINLNHDPYYDSYRHMSSQDMITSHSALLAVKFPNQAQGSVNNRMGSVTRILNDILYGSGKFEGENEHMVLLKQKKGKKELVRVPMPAF